MGPLQVDPRSAVDARAQEILGTTTFHNGQRYDVGMLWVDDNIQLPNNYFSSLVQLKSLEKRLSRDTSLKGMLIPSVKTWEKVT